MKKYLKTFGDHIREEDFFVSIGILIKWNLERTQTGKKRKRRPTIKSLCRQ